MGVRSKSQVQKITVVLDTRSNILRLQLQPLQIVDLPTHQGVVVSSRADQLLCPFPRLLNLSRRRRRHRRRSHIALN